MSGRGAWKQKRSLRAPSLYLSMNYTGYVYLWYDTRAKLFYLGGHLGRVEDSYVCSSGTMSPVCSSSFIDYSGNTRYCSIPCRVQNSKEKHRKIKGEKIPHICVVCGVDFFPKHKEQVYCSRSCSGKHKYRYLCRKGIT